MDLDSLHAKFQSAKTTTEICECIIEGLKIRQEIIDEAVLDELPPKLMDILDRGDLLIYESLKDLNEGNPERAEDYLHTLINWLQPIPDRGFYIYYLLGRAKYLEGDYVRALKGFNVYERYRHALWEDEDEICMFYRANCFAMQGYFEEAAKIYVAILMIKKDFPEVKRNLEIIMRKSNEDLVLEVSSFWNACDWRDIPIFINARDRHTTMKKLIDWLLNAGYRNVIILDNASTYIPLLKYYSKLERNPAVKVIRLGGNLGFKALWKSGVLEKLQITTPYVYTDPDVLPAANCPKDIVRILYEYLNSNHEIRKVGLGIVWEDITFYDKDKWQEYERKFQVDGRIDDNIAFAQVDTTFALYPNIRGYSLRSALQTLGDMRCRHLPWYFDYKNLPKDEKYYMKHADHDSVTSVKDKIKI